VFFKHYLMEGLGRMLEIVLLGRKRREFWENLWEKYGVGFSGWTKVLFLIKGYVIAYWEKLPHFSDFRPVYVVWCKRHGFFRLYFNPICPKCFPRYACYEVKD